MQRVPNESSFVEIGLASAEEGYPEHREFPDWPLEELRTKKGTADLYRMVYGPLSAQWIMPLLGFPSPPRELIDTPRQLTLPLET